jgi:hypothetical protein
MKMNKNETEDIAVQDAVDKVLGPVPKTETMETVIKNTFQCSCQITKNSKGYGWEVKSSADSMEEAVKLALEANAELKKELIDQI